MHPLVIEQVEVVLFVEYPAMRRFHPDPAQVVRVIAQGAAQPDQEIAEQVPGQ